MEAPHLNSSLIFHDGKKNFVNRNIIIKNGIYTITLPKIYCANDIK